MSSHGDTNRLSDDTVRYIQRMQAHRDELEAENQQLRDALERVRPLVTASVVDWALSMADTPSEFRRIVEDARAALAAVRVEER